MFSKIFKNKKQGFTLIELLVVIAIISLLSSIIFASLVSAREKAAIASIILVLKETEKAFFLLANDENITQWWLETSFGKGSNPDIAALITDTNRLGKYLQQTPRLTIGTNLGFDNDNDIFVCGDGGTVYRGVNLHIRNISLAVTQKISTLIDGNTDTACGRIKWDSSSNGSLFYVISESYLNY